MSVEDLNRSLYERGRKIEGIRRSPLSVARGEGPTSWSGPAPPPPRPRPRFLDSWSNRILAISAIIFLVTMIGGAAALFGNFSAVSDSSIKIVIQGPSSIKAGDEVPITVSITNNNRVPLEAANLSITYPEGTKDVNGADLVREERPLGTILPGVTKNLVLKPIIYGPESSNPETKIVLGYNLSGSNALFQKDASFQTVINSPSLNLSTTLPDQLISNQPLSFDVKLSGNDQKTLTNVLLTVDYPPGFSFQSATPPPFAGNNIWSLGDFPPGSDQTVTINGVLEGQDQEVKSFSFNAGQASAKDASVISAKYAALFRTITISRPFIATTLNINGNDTPEYIAQAGEKIRLDLDWVNNLPAKVENASFKIYLTGKAFDGLSVNADRGFYQSADNTVTWNKNSNPELALLDPGASGRLSVQFNILAADKLAASGANLLGIKLVVDGLRVDSDISQREITTELDKDIKVGSSLQLVARGVYYVGPFESSGPIPPKVGTQTTYTIIWSVANPSGLVRSGVARVNLGDSVKWLNLVSPTSEKVSYDETNNQVVWQLGDVAAGTGSSLPAREVSFQVGLTPSLSQVGHAVNLLEQTAFSGYDTFADVPVNRTADAVTTAITTDPQWTIGSGNDKVTQ